MDLKTVKIGLIGDCKTGKTSLARFFATSGDFFSGDYFLTSGVEVFTKILSKVKQPENPSSTFLGADNGVQITEMECQGLVEHIKVKVYDFGGSEIYREPIVFPVLEKLSDFVIIYDVGRRESWDGVGKWLQILKEKVQKCDNVVVLGNLQGETREVSEDEAKQWCLQRNLEYFETGLVQYGEVDQVFKGILQRVVESNC